MEKIISTWSCRPEHVLTQERLEPVGELSVLQRRNISEHLVVRSAAQHRKRFSDSPCERIDSGQPPHHQGVQRRRQIHRPQIRRRRASDLEVSLRVAVQYPFTQRRAKIFTDEKWVAV